MTTDQLMTHILNNTYVQHKDTQNNDAPKESKTFQLYVTRLPNLTDYYIIAHLLSFIFQVL